MNSEIWSVEGNIGSGKSTLIKMLKEINNNKNIIFIPEPVDEWSKIKDKNGKTILERFYENQDKWSFSFQMMAYISRLSLLKKALKKNYDIIITERSVYTDKEVFAKMLYDDKKIEDVEYSIYLKWFHEFLEELPPISLIYVKTDPQVAFDRVKIRSRKGEHIPLEYLENCHNYHENWLKGIPSSQKMLVLDANYDIKTNPHILSEWVEKIECFINCDKITRECKL